MRPVNLIPPEERHGEHRPMRTGPVPYLLVGALLAVLAGVTALVLTGNQIADRKSEVAKVEREDAVASARAKRLSAYTQFRTLREQRVQTVTSLADSRFDWERVMRELSLVLPHDVWLTSLEASAAPGGAEGGGSSGSSGGSGLSSSIAGPSLTISGCATGHDAVAGFVTALKEIDGVTRVGVESSELSSQKEGAGKSGGSGGSGSSGGGESSDCRTRSFIAEFKMVVAFDAAPVPQIASSGEAPATPAGQAQTASSETSKSGEASAGGEASKAPAGGG
jgi:Tfp pilus assembly protein PilN